MYKRMIDLRYSNEETCFLWGPRQTGKSTLLKQRFPDNPRFDLLRSDVYRRFLANPALLREELAADAHPTNVSVIIDEVQKVPDLLDEVHWMIENRGYRFILCGSSARKLKRKHANLLGGRAIRLELHPLAYPEIPDFSIEQALTWGLLPRHYLHRNPTRLLQSYVGDYLKEEIADEALTRNIPAFNRFLEVAALCNGELINFNNIASDCGVSMPTAKNYFGILEDTLLGHFLPAFRKRAKRRLIGAPKFFFFDVGIVGYLTRRGPVVPGSELFGRAFEHFIHMEIMAHRAYSGLFYPLSYWRTASQFEVDFILGEPEIAVEVKGAASANDRHLKGLRAFKEEHPAGTYVLVSLDPAPRRTADGIDILPWRVFLEKLWDGKLIR
ncbi:MAG: ATP-binding protein [Lentisphaerae bacterium]|nr:ATP-binding protein [Lentisphaerota bacterium]